MARFIVRPLVVQTVRAWYEERNGIDLSPSYQRRGGVWSKHDKAFLVDSIINGYDIPKLYFADFTMIDSSLNLKKKQYAVIDGKQRLVALFGFLENLFGLDTGFVFLEITDVEARGAHLLRSGLESPQDCLPRRQLHPPGDERGHG